MLTIDADSNANSGAIAAFPTANAFIDIDGPTNSTGTIMTDIGAATLRADVLTVEAIVDSVNTLAEADAVAGALGVDSDGKAETNVKLAVDVLIQSGANLEGEECAKDEYVDNFDLFPWRRNIEDDCIKTFFFKRFRGHSLMELHIRG